MRRNRWTPLRFGDPRKRKAAREERANSDWILPAEAITPPTEEIPDPTAIKRPK